MASESSFLFYADAQAALETASDLQSGQQMLYDSYNSTQWDDPKKASDILAQYSDLLSKKFEDKEPLSATKVQQYAPITPDEVEGDTAEAKWDAWGKANKDFLLQTDDPDYSLIRTKLIKGVEEIAANEKAKARSESRPLDFFQDAANRFALGAVGQQLKLVGAESVLQEINENLNPERNDDWSSAFFSGLGSVAGVVGSAVAAGPLGIASYLSTAAAGSMREVAEEAQAAGASDSRAFAAAAIEGVSQAGQGVVGAKVFGPLATTVRGKIFGDAAEGAAMGIAKAGLLEGSTEAAGGVVSQVARKVGTQDENLGYFDGLWTNFSVGAVLGSGADGVNLYLTKGQPQAPDTVDPSAPPIPVNVVGAVTEAYTTPVIPAEGNVTYEGIEGVPNKGDLVQWTSNSQEMFRVPRKITEVSEDGSLATVEGSDTLVPVSQLTKQRMIVPVESITAEQAQADFLTTDGKRYTVTDEGATQRVDIATGTASKPMDRTFFVSPDMASKLALLRSKKAPDGSIPQILTDGESLLVKGYYVTPALDISDKNTGSRLTKVPTVQLAPGNHPVEVARPRTSKTQGNTREYRSFIGAPIATVFARSAGAAEATPRKLSKRVGKNPALDEAIRAGLVDDVYGQGTYLVQPNIVTANIAQSALNTFGPATLTNDILNYEGEFTAAKNEVARQLVMQYNQAARDALNENDTPAYERYAAIAVDIAQKVSEKATTAGQAVQALRLWSTLDPSMRVANTLGKLRRKAREKVAKSEGISIEQIEQNEAELAAIETELSDTVQQAEQTRTVLEKQYDADLQRANSQLAEIDKEASLRQNLDNEQATQRITDAEIRIKEIEQRGQERLQQLEADVRDAEARLSKLQEKEQLTKRDQANKENIAEILTEAKDKLEPFKAVKGLKDREVSQVARLRRFIIEQEKKSNQTRDAYLTKAEKQTATRIKESRDRLRNLKAEVQKNAGPVLTPQQTERMTRLRERKTKLEKLREKIEAAEKESEKKFTPEDREQMVDLLTAAKDLSGSNLADILDRVDTLQAKALGTHKPWTWHAVWHSNVLSGPGTHIKIAGSNISQTAGNILAYAVTDVRKGRLGEESDTKDFIEGMWSARGRAWDTIRHIWETGDIILSHGANASPDMFSNYTAAKSDLWKNGPPVYRQMVGWVQLALRMGDAYFQVALNEGQARVLAKRVQDEDVKAVIADTFFNMQEHWDNALLQAKKEAAVLSKIGINKGERWNRVRAYEILELQRPADFRIQTNRFASRVTMANKAEGVMGAVVQKLNEAGRSSKATFKVGGKEIHPLPYLLPFLNPAANIINASLDWTPFGLIQTEATTKNQNQVERELIVSKMMFGSAAMAALFAIGVSSIDDEDPFFTIYGDGPSNWDQKKSMMATGWQPFSVKVGGHYFKYSTLAGASSLAAVGGALDAVRYDKKYPTANIGEAATLIIGSSVKNFMNNSFLQTITGLINLAQDPRQADAVRVLTAPAKGFIFGVGELRAASQMMHDPIESRNDLVATMISGIPVIQAAGRPVLNHFGERVTDGATALDRLGRISGFYANRVDGPEWNWLAENGYTISDPGVTVKLTPTESRAYGKLRAERLGAKAADVLTVEERYDFIEKTGPRIKEAVNAFMRSYPHQEHDEAIQEKLNDTINTIRAQARREIALGSLSSDTVE